MDDATAIVKDRMRFAVIKGSCFLLDRGRHGNTPPRIKYNGRYVYVRNVVAEASLGPPLSDQYTVNTCGNNNCIRPEHVKWVCRGGVSRYSPLTADTVLAISVMLYYGHAVEELAATFNSSLEQITRIRDGKIWSKITGRNDKYWPSQKEEV